MRRFMFATIAVVLVVGAGACGGDSDDEGGGGPTVTTGDGAGATDDTSADDTSADDTLDPGDVPFLGDDCEFLLAGAFLNPLAGAVPGADVDFEASADQLAAVADAAPEEIRDAMVTLSEGYAAFAEALAGVDLSDPQAFSDPAVLEKLESVEDVFDEEYEAASQAVTNYVDANCSPP